MSWRCSASVTPLRFLMFGSRFLPNRALNALGTVQARGYDVDPQRAIASTDPRDNLTRKLLSEGDQHPYPLGANALAGESPK